MEDVLKKIRGYAAKTSVFDGLTDGEYFDASESGNYDDTFQLGIEEGEVSLARELLKLLGEG